MRTLLLIILVLHGLIHLMGLMKAFHMAELSQLTQVISRPVGILWLISTFLFGITATLLLFKVNSWYIFAIAAVVLSQMLIIMSWQDAKYGTIANLIILSAAIIG